MTALPVEALRTGAALAAIVLAVLSRGDALALAAVLAVAAWRLPALAVIPALVASSWRWGSTSLDALAGAQAVLGPAGFVGPSTAALATWLAGATVLLALSATDADADAEQVGGMGDPERDAGAPNLRARLVPIAAAATAAAVVAGPAPGGRLWVRFVGAGLAWGAVLALSWLRQRAALAVRVLDLVAVVTGVGALLVITREAPGWAGTIDAGAARDGVAIAVAVTALLIMERRLRQALPARTS